MDEKLSWNSHVKYIVGKVGKRAGVLGRIRRNLTSQSVNIVYKLLIRPILGYSDCVWGTCGGGNSKSFGITTRKSVCSEN